MIEAGARQNPDVPRNIVVSLSGLGKNPYGEPLYRCVWGNARMDWIGGKWENDKTDAGLLLPPWVGVKKAPRYFGPGANRWHLEQWKPAPCSPEDWEKHFTEFIDGTRVEMLGPYPSRGDYEAIASFDNEYITHPNIILAMLALIQKERDKTQEQRRVEREQKRAEQNVANRKLDEEAMLGMLDN